MQRSADRAGFPGRSVTCRRPSVSAPRHVQVVSSPPTRRFRQRAPRQSARAADDEPPATLLFWSALASALCYCLFGQHTLIYLLRHFFDSNGCGGPLKQIYDHDRCGPGSGTGRDGDGDGEAGDVRRVTRTASIGLGAAADVHREQTHRPQLGKLRHRAPLAGGDSGHQQTCPKTEDKGTRAGRSQDHTQTLSRTPRS